MNFKNQLISETFQYVGRTPIASTQTEILSTYSPSSYNGWLPFLDGYGNQSNLFFGYNTNSYSNSAYQNLKISNDPQGNSNYVIYPGTNLNNNNLIIWNNNTLSTLSSIQITNNSVKLGELTYDLSKFEDGKAIVIKGDKVTTSSTSVNNVFANEREKTIPIHNLSWESHAYGRGEHYSPGANVTWTLNDLNLGNDVKYLKSLYFQIGAKTTRYDGNFGNSSDYTVNVNDTSFGPEGYTLNRVLYQPPASWDGLYYLYCVPVTKNFVSIKFTDWNTGTHYSTTWGGNRQYDYFRTVKIIAVTLNIVNNN